ncbi:amidohydrolase family protein [Dermatobacter hominis]|uniref:amidohydrolase family protein n=1 Tax=Dermatobacter hominis TaxID=2884263 RepID=UPI001D124396|nr:amidohydrolase family protein [Dermatobacter hominis]UDY35360.1 amidohydrolase [Dermatobacter hominis]
MHDEPVIDADNHYYEALDAFTRHLDPAWAQRTVQWCDIDGRKYHVIGGRVSRAVTNATFDPIARAGAMHDYFRGNPDGRDPLSFLSEREPIRPEYRDRDARIEVLDQQGLESCWMFPTLGMIYEELLTDDPQANCVVFRAFNRWVEEDWGFSYRDRIFAAPYLTLADPDWAVEELRWALDAGARLLVMRPAAPTTVLGRVSPFDDRYARFWGLLNESGVPLVLHAGDGGVSSNGYAPEGFSAAFSGGFKPSIKFFAIEQAIKDFLLAMLLENHLVRYPDLRIVSVENGAEFLPDLFRKARSMAKKVSGYFPDDPVEILRRQVWINPFWEDDVVTVVDHMGADRVVFGSDWPHIEGMPQPLDYLPEVKELSPEDQRLVLHDNAAGLISDRPA